MSHAAPSPRFIPVRSRWRHCGGDVIDCFDRTVPFAQARATAEGWMRQALEAQERGDTRISKLCAHDALTLQAVASLAYEFRRRNGVSDPFAEAPGDAA